jgi:type IV secretory pathway TrbD component
MFILIIKQNILSRDWLQTGFGLVIGFIGHLQSVATNKHDILIYLHIRNISVTTSHMKSSRSSLVVWEQDIPVLQQA